MLPPQTLSEYDPRPGALVRATRPDGGLESSNLPIADRRKIGIVIAAIPGDRGKTNWISEFTVAWFGPRFGGDFITTERGHRLEEIRR